MLQPSVPELPPTPDTTDDHPIETARTARLEAVVAALADRERVVELLFQAHDEDHAATLIGDALGLEPAAATGILDLQLKQLTSVRRAALADDLAVRTTPWGPAVTLQATFPTATTARISIDGAEHQVRTRTRHDTQIQLVELVMRLVARPRLRPVTIETGNRETIVVQPDGSATWHDEAPG